MSSLYCTDALGMPVAYLSNNSISDVAVATVSNGAPVVFYNPVAVMNMNPATRQFFAYHECAHHATGHILEGLYGQTLGITEEQEADCWAIRTMMSNGELTPMALSAVQGDLYMFGKGDWSHLPGPQRAINLQACLADMVDLTPYIEKQEEAVKEFKELKGRGDKFDQRASACLVEKKSSDKKIKWNASAEDPTVDYKFEYENTCLCPVSGSFYIATGDIPKNHKDGDHSSWVAYDVGENSISLDPGESQVVSGALVWNPGRTLDLMPMIRRPLSDKDRFLMQVKFATSGGKCEQQVKKDEETGFCEAVKAIYSAPFGDTTLADFTGKVIKEWENVASSRVRYSSKLTIPGLIEATINKHTDKKNNKVTYSWSGTLFDGPIPKADARKRFLDFVDRVEGCFNSPLLLYREKDRVTRKTEESFEDGYEMISVNFPQSKFNAWSLSLVGNEKEGYSAFMGINP